MKYIIWLEQHKEQKHMQKESDFATKFNKFFEDIGITQGLNNLTRKPLTKEPEIAKDINKFFEKIGLTKGITEATDSLGKAVTNVVVK